METWPRDLLIARDITIALVPRTLRSPPSLTGRTQVVASDAPLWSVTFDGIEVRSAAQVLAWRALEARLEGQLGTVLVPLYGAWQPNFGRPRWPDLLATPGKYNSVTATAPAAARTASLDFEIEHGGPIEPGHGFSIGQRYYRARSVTMDEGEATGTMTIQPYLRDAVADGAELVFDRPVCRMRLASDGEMRLTMVQHRAGEGSVTFIEDV